MAVPLHPAGARDGTCKAESDSFTELVIAAANQIMGGIMLPFNTILKIMA